MLVNALAEISRKKHVTVAQISLAWLLARRPWIVPIPGTRNHSRMLENIGSLDVRLSEDDLQFIDSIHSQNAVHGARYGDSDMAMVNG
jgi:aryl-alcohol dehydrogenase-like predicted oxidoreductase